MMARMVLRLSVIVQGLVILSVRFAIRLAACAGRLPVEAPERRAKIIEQGRKIARQRRASADQHIVMVRAHRHTAEQPNRLAQPAPDAVALGGGAVLLGDGESDSD